MKRLFMIMIALLCAACTQAKASELDILEHMPRINLTLPTETMGYYAEWLTSKFMSCCAKHLPQNMRDMIQKHPYISAPAVTAIFFITCYGVYLGGAAIMSAGTFIMELDDFVRAGFVTTYSVDLTKNLNGIDAILTQSEGVRLALVGTLKERIGIHPQFSAPLEYYGVITYLSFMFNLSWSAVKNAGQFHRMAGIDGVIP